MVYLKVRVFSFYALSVRCFPKMCKLLRLYALFTKVKQGMEINYCRIPQRGDGSVFRVFLRSASLPPRVQHSNDI